MAVPLDDLHACLQRGIVERIAHGAETAAHAGDDAALTQFPPGHETVPLHRPGHLCPKAKNFAGTNYRAMQCPGRHPEILHLPCLEGELRICLLMIQHRSGFAQHWKIRGYCLPGKSGSLDFRGIEESPLPAENEAFGKKAGILPDGGKFLPAK